MVHHNAFDNIQDALGSVDPVLRSGLERLLQRIDAAELSEREPRDIVGAANSMRSLAASRKSGETLISVFTPTLAEHGWTSRRTIVNICTDDSPFLVDSVTMAAARMGLTVQFILHPIVAVSRDAAGELIDIENGDDTPESWIHLEVDRVSTEEGRAEFVEVLQSVIGDVHLAVNDWQAMRNACLKVVEELQTDTPGSVNPDSVEPTIEFLNWLADDNFTFLGYREHALDVDENGEEVLRPLSETGLGILSKRAGSVSRLQPEARRTAREPRLLTITKANSRATVHRDAYLDYIGLRTFDAAGNVTGERRILGMFTSAVDTAPVQTLPIVGPKVRAVIEASGYPEQSHSARDLRQVLANLPREELFQGSVDHLLNVATEVSRLRDRRRAQIFMRRDEFNRYVTALVYLPKDRFNTSVIPSIDELLRDAFGAVDVEHETRVGDSSLAQLYFVAHGERGSSVPDVQVSELQDRLELALRGWDEGLVDSLHLTVGEELAAELLARYSSSFPVSYKERVAPENALGDINLLEGLDTSDFGVRLYGAHESEPGKRVLTLASNRQYPLTQVLPVLTDLGVDVVDERPYTFVLADGSVRYLSDYGLTATSNERWDDADWGATFEEAFSAVWTGDAESDKLNSLVLHAGLDARRVIILRAISMYLSQVGSAFSVEYIEQALIANAAIASDLVRLFELRFDPAENDDREAREAAQVEALKGSLDAVSSLDHDRILRSMIGVITATWRTNFYQPTADGDPKSWVSMKIDCASVPGMPKPHPMAEIWVYSPEVEGVHMRFGAVARGGLRWSDRREDFRTEVLGLVKAQMVKNAVIVPSGSKGGFVAKKLPSPSDRAAWLEGGKDAYRTFIRGMLDITDNRDGDTIIAPTSVVRHDGDDPYLVVAADKGTASFSDTANAISEEYDFWLADAFASGGSAGYDHKGMGITARGAWESVKRHFRELGHDTQTEDFTVVGIGDMSGDVFGNGMLRSEHIRLVAAFDHRHVFIDPNPDAAATFVERQRLFNTPGSTWDDFDRSLMSKGSGVFPLAAKTAELTPEIIEALGLDPSVTSLAPLELKRAALLAPVDLIWNGAIGTYIKATDETHAEIGDHSNDVVRVNGSELRARVVGEGGNLGVSQRGRIEAALSGVSINTDAIDNSAGVGTSDREVNIKILLGAIERDGRLDRPARNELLKSMTDEVGVQVLRDNYEQNVLLGNSRSNATEMLPSHERLMEWLEERDELDRDMESLPNAAEIRTRIEEGRGLTRPEFAVLLAYSKLALKDDLATTALAEDPWFANTVSEYFPEPMRAPFADDLSEHPLRSEIIVNSVVNSMVNRGGITFAYRAADETGAENEQIARAYVAVREIFDLRGFVIDVEATDNVVPTSAQTDLYLTFRRLLDRATRWFVQHRPDGVDIGTEIELFRDSVQRFTRRMDELLRGEELARFHARAEELRAASVPADLAQLGAGLLESTPLLDIIERSRLNGWDLDETAAVYYELSARMHFDDTLVRVTALPQNDRWGSMARAAMRDDLYAVMIELTASVFERTEAGSAEARIDSWIEQGGPTARRALDDALAAVAAGNETGLATLSVALRRLRSLVR